MAPEGVFFKSARILLAQDALLIKVFEALVRIVARFQGSVMAPAILAIESLLRVEAF